MANDDFQEYVKQLVTKHRVNEFILFNMKEKNIG